MNIIGIDYQQTLSVIALREGRGVSAPTTSIGDGRRVLVPHAVTAAGTWGSDALRDASAACYQPLDPVHDGPWLESPAAGLFWQGLYARLVSYLGRVKPNLANGYQTTIALQGDDWQAARSGVQSLCTQAGLSKNDSAGLREATFIPTTEALLCRWLSAPSTFAPVPNPDSDRPETRKKSSEELPAEAVITVAAGDNSTLIGAYRVQRDYAGHWHISARPTALQHLSIGLSAWQTHLLSEVCSRFSEECGPDSTPELRDSALDFAWQITQAAADKELTWRGAGQERMYAPLCLTHAECARWPETQTLQTLLPPALNRAAAALGKTVRPDRILVGGVGALWPFAGEIADRVAPTWSSSSPQTDIAFGAAAWREVSGDILHLTAADIRIEAIRIAGSAEHTPSPSTPVQVPTSPSPVLLPTSSAPPAPPSAASRPAEKPASPPVQTSILTPHETPPPAEKLQEADKTPPAHHAPVDSDEWNAPEPGLKPPWERE
ncbi:MAG: hypothetical protein JWL77_2507 [Chthonomonadaceae bacterium]|nr:hypothetical protein [Chthonomonadaceae bacterium]